jgi:hypothetical protein
MPTTGAEGRAGEPTEGCPQGDTTERSEIDFRRKPEGLAKRINLREGGNICR